MLFAYVSWSETSVSDLKKAGLNLAHSQGQSTDLPPLAEDEDVQEVESEYGESEDTEE